MIQDGLGPVRWSAGSSTHFCRAAGVMSHVLPIFSAGSMPAAHARRILAADIPQRLAAWVVVR